MTVVASPIEYLRGSLPRGVTKIAVAKSFAKGMSMHNLAWLYWCSEEAIEEAIRTVLRRQGGA